MRDVEEHYNAVDVVEYVVLVLVYWVGVLC
mgnify:CR=1 FL=1